MIISFEVLDFLLLQWSLRSLAERDELQVALNSPSDFFKLRHARSNAGPFTDSPFDFVIHLDLLHLDLLWLV
jgi:hypothetical protein